MNDNQILLPGPGLEAPPETDGPAIGHQRTAPRIAPDHQERARCAILVLSVVPCARRPRLQGEAVAVSQLLSAPLLHPCPGAAREVAEALRQTGEGTPWARKGSAFTLLFEQTALTLVREMPVNAAARARAQGYRNDSTFITMICLTAGPAGSIPESI